MAMERPPTPPSGATTVDDGAWRRVLAPYKQRSTRAARRACCGPTLESPSLSSRSPARWAGAQWCWCYGAGVQGSSYFDLPPDWLTGNIGYHHIQHLASQIPNYRLARCFQENNPELQKVTRLTLRDGLRTLSLKLWDEESHTLVGFDAVPTRVNEGEPS